MKKILSTFLLATVLCCSVAFPVSADEDKPYAGTTINVYNWGEYIPDGADGSLDINKEFTKRTGINVEYVTYDDNETMYSKITSGAVSYDIVIPSDYMIERMVKENLLQKLDYSNIPNYKYISEQYKGLYYDINNEYSVPYAVGAVGLIYNTKYVDEVPTSWSIMWDEKYKGKILQFNNPRDAFMTAQVLLASEKNVSLDTYVNTNDEALIKEAAEKLKEQKPLIQSYVMDEVYNIMEAGEASIAPYYAGDFLTMYDNNSDLAFVYPKEGTNYFVDAACIPTCAKNKAAAELYINFLNEPDIALEIAEFIYYATPNTAVLDNEEYSLFQNEIVYPDYTNMNTVMFKNLEVSTLNKMSSLWDEVRQSGNDYTKIYIGLGIVVLIGLGFYVFRAIQKKKREQ